MTATYIISATRITKVWIALGGDALKGGRARAFYRDGNNPQAVSLNDSKGVWFDHRDNVGGGVLDLIQRVLGYDRAGALRWLSNFTGLPIEDQPATCAERRAFVEQRERKQREIVDAEMFRIAAGALVEQILEELPEADPERFGPTQLLLSLRRADDGALLALYRDWREHQPGLTAALVFAGEQAWRRKCDALARFVTTLAGAEDAA